MIASPIRLAFPIRPIDRFSLEGGEEIAGNKIGNLSRDLIKDLTRDLIAYSFPSMAALEGSIPSLLNISTTVKHFKHQLLCRWVVRR